MDKISVSLFSPSANINGDNTLNVNNLFSNSNYNTSEELNTNNISNYYNNNHNNNNTLKFNIDKLIKLREERKKKVLIHYEKIFNICLNKITLANNMNKTETIYQVPDAVYGTFDYDKYECMQYIEDKLKKMCLDTLILGNNNIYISWINLENNIKTKH